jgi:hypothetical protein
MRKEKAVSSTVRPNDSLAQLSEEYTYRVNMVLDEGREDLATALAAEYERKTMELLSSQVAG